MNKISKMQFSSNLIWKLAEQFSSVALSLILAMILARLLEPADFGAIALITIFTLFSDIFVQAGFNTALVQKKETDALDYSTVMVLSIGVGAILYFGIFLFAPYVADYFEIEELTAVLRCFSIIILINGLNATLSSAAIRQMKFRLLFRANLTSTIVSGIASVILAFMGYGIWTLVLQKILQQIMITIIISVALKWKYSIAFSIDRAKSLFAFSSKVLGSSIIAFISDNTYSAIIGKVYSTRDLGYSSKADTLPSAVVLNAVTALMSVLLPTFSSYQENIEEMKHVARRIVRTATYIIFPMVFGLAVTAKGVIILVFSEKWLPSVPLLQALCLWYLTIPVLQILGQVMYALGRSDVRLKLEFTKMCITVSTLLLLVLTYKAKLYVLILMKGIISLFMIILNSFYTKRYINYGLFEQCCDMTFPFMYSVIMAGFVWTVPFLKLNVYCTVLIQIVLGIGVYLGISLLLREKSLQEIIIIIKTIFQRYN